MTNISSESKTKSPRPVRYDQQGDLIFDIGSTVWAHRKAMPHLITCEALVIFLSWSNLQWFAEPLAQDRVEEIASLFCTEAGS